MEFLVHLARLAAGILAIQDPQVVEIDAPRALAYAAAADTAAQRYGIDPWDLPAIARNESAFKEDDLGRYNSGVHDARHGWAGRYWLRVSCYAAAARAGVAADRCVKVRSRHEIAQRVGRSRPGGFARR